MQNRYSVFKFMHIVTLVKHYTPSETPAVVLSIQKN